MNIRIENVAPSIQITVNLLRKLQVIRFAFRSPECRGRPSQCIMRERPVRNRSDLPPLAEQSCSRCASVENGSAVVQHLHGGAIYRVHRSTYSVDEQYSGEGCSTERPKTLTGVWGVLLLQQNRLRELRRVLLSGHGRLREEGRKAMKPV